MIDPPEATVHIGETQSFMALVNGAVNAGIQWAVQEADGGSITKVVAKVTVVMQYDTRPN